MPGTDLQLKDHEEGLLVDECQDQGWRIKGSRGTTMPLSGCISATVKRKEI